MKAQTKEQLAYLGVWFGLSVFLITAWALIFTVLILAMRGAA